MNKVILMGRLTKDPTVTYSQGQNQMAIARWNLAVDRRVSRDKQQDGQPTADFLNCVAFGRQAEFAEKYLSKGIKIVVEGHIQTGSYTNKEGQKVYTTDIIVDNLEFAESKSAQQNGNRPSGGDGFINVPDTPVDGLPFQ